MAKPQYIALSSALSGESSRAYLGLHINNGVVEPIVIIWVPDQVKQDPEQVTHLRNETDRAVQLEHPHVIRVYGLIEVADHLARVVEYVNGESLRSILDIGQRIEPGLAARIIADAAAGVHYAHLAGNDDGTPLLHGDLRPETILVSYAGVTKVSGYGALSVAPKEIGGKRVLGRRQHSAPEQILGGRTAISGQTDVYLLGLTLYEMLTGTIPFQDEANFGQAVVNKELPLLNDPKLIPDSLRPVIAKATAKRNTDRYQTPEALREAIEQALDGALPSSEAVGYYLEELFEQSAVRAKRQAIIDQGIAQYAQGMRLKETPKPPVPAAKPVSQISAPSAKVLAPPSDQPVVVTPPSKSAEPVEPVLAAVSPHPVKHPVKVKRSVHDDQPAKRGLKFSTVLAVVGAVALLVLIWLLRGDSDSSTKPASTPAKTATASAASPSASSSDSENAPASTDPAAPKAASAPLPSLADEIAATADKTYLQISTNPAVDVIIDGKNAGRVPLKVELEPGSHKLSLVNTSLGIRASRTVNVRPEGITRAEFSIGRGSVTVNAPSGARIFLDGKLAGEAPLNGVGVYEGNHRIMVQMGKAKWGQAFSLRTGETMKFDVEVNNSGPPE